MYRNLVQCMKNKGLSVNAVAKILGMPEPTLRGKIIDGRAFTIDEAIRTKLMVFPEYDLAYLFAAEKEEEDLI